MEQGTLGALEQGRVLERLCLGGICQRGEVGGRKEQKTLFQNPVCLSLGAIACVTVDSALPECRELSPHNAVPSAHGRACIPSIQKGCPL